jgi:hypothetical protein
MEVTGGKEEQNDNQQGATKWLVKRGDEKCSGNQAVLRNGEEKCFTD